MEKKTTRAVSLEQVLLPEKILDYAPVDFFTGAKKNHRSRFTGAGTVARENF